jgi:hypothetical protein
MLHELELPIHPSLVHPLTGCPLTAVGMIGGRPVWPILGGAEDDEKDDTKSDDAAKDDDKSDDDDEKDDDKLDPEDDPDSIEYWKKRSRQNERAARKAARELEAAKKAPGAKTAAKSGAKDDGRDGEQPDAEQIRAEARAEAAAEILRERVSDKIEAKAKDFADPEDAVAIVLRSHEIDDFLDDKKIDVEAINEALKDLAKNKPHLLAQGKRFQGSGDGGARQQKPGRPKSLGEALKRHYSADDK